MATVTDPNAPTRAGQAPIAGGHSGTESKPFVASPPDDSALKQAYLEIQEREKKLPDLATAAADARKALDDDKYYTVSTDDAGVTTRTLNSFTIQAYTQAAKHADDLEKAYQDEVNNLTTQWTNIARILADNQNNAAQRGMDAAKLGEDRAQAERMAGFYRAQQANYQADADQKNAEAIYNAALREAYPAAQQAAHQKRVTEAKIALDTANSRLTDSQAAAQEAANGVAPELAQAGLAIQQAKASSAGSQATIDAATAANAPAASAATTSSLQSQAAIDAANAAVAPEAAATAIKAAAARGDLDATQAAEIMALLEGKKAYAQAQIEGQQAANEQTRLTTHQLRVGDIQTKIEQLSAAVKGDPENGVPGMDPAEADRLMEDYLSGSTPFQRQQQRETQISGAMGQALSYGMGVLPGQQYLPGAEPGGAYDKVFGQLGVDLPNVQLTDAQPLTSFVQAQGIQTQEQPAPRMFSATGSYTPPAANAPTAVPAAPPPTAAGQPTHAAVPVVTTAQLLGPQQPTQAAAEGGTYYNPDDYYPVDILGPFPQSTGNMTGMGGSRYPNISGTTGDMLPSSTPYVVDPRRITPNAAGGTTVVPRAMQGMLQQPKVDRIPIFAARKAERRPMFAGG